MAGDMGAPSAAKKTSGERWPLWKLIIIALPQLGVQVLWCFIGPNSAEYMLHLGMGPALATLNNIAGPITGFFTGPIVGATSDSLTSKFGRRRPVIFTGLVLTWVAGMFFSLAQRIFPGHMAIYFAAPMYWVMDVTINILQTPHRALVADLAEDDQQVPMQVVFVIFMAMGNFLAFSIMQIYEVPVEHMFELMMGICLLNTVCIGIQFMVAKETPLERDPNAPKASKCAPVMNVVEAVKSSPGLLYHLAAVQCLVWIGNTAWNIYGEMWFTHSVFEGRQKAAPGSLERQAYHNGVRAFSHGGQCRSVLQLVAALAIIVILINTTLRPRLVYAPCIFIGAVASILAASVVGHQAMFAIACFTLSVMPEVGSFAIPFGLVATLNKRAEKEGKPVSTALQMSLLNCCVTVGQQICTLSLAFIMGRTSMREALPRALMLAGVAQVMAGGGALFLDDAPVEDEEECSSDEDNLDLSMESDAESTVGVC